MYSLHKIPVSVLFIFLSSSASGSYPYSIKAGAAEAGMGYSCSMKPGFWSSFHNQASLAFNKSLSVGINYENRFNINELGTRSIGLIIPAGNTSLGILYSHFGYKDFIRHTIGFACGLSLSPKMSAGIQLDYFAENTPGEYNQRRSFTFETGIIISASDKLQVSFHLFNPVPGSFRKIYLPSSIRIGAGIHLSKDLFASSEVQISTGKSLNIKAGFEYKAVKNFWVRGGFNSENSAFCFGSGYQLNLVRLDLSFVTHDKLGVTTSASLVFQIH